MDIREFITSPNGSQTLNPSGGDDTAGIQAALNAGNVALGAGTFQVSSTLNIKDSFMVGQGPGLLWNADTDLLNRGTILKWTGTTNSTPMIKIKGSTTVSSETDSIAIIRGLQCLYSGSATGTDAIYMDGENGLVRHIFIDDVNLVKFSGSGIHSKGTVFDVNYYRTGVVFSTGDNILIEVGTPFTGNPTQHFFYDLVSLINASGKFALNTAAANTVLLGGTVGNGAQGGSGVNIVGVDGFGSFGVNFEGAGSGVAGTGLTYTGSQFQVEGGRIISWQTGLQIGIATSAQAINWNANTKFASNGTDILVTAGGNRYGKIGEIADQTLTTLTNNRGGSDGVWTEVERVSQFPVAANGTVNAPASPGTITNQDNRKEILVLTALNGGSVSAITYRGTAGYPTGLNAFPFLLLPGQTIIVTWATAAPTFTKYFL